MPTSAASPRALDAADAGERAGAATCSAASPRSRARVAGRAQAARRLHRVGRAADGRRQLDAGADRGRRRPQPVRRRRQALRLDAVGGAGAPPTRRSSSSRPAATASRAASRSCRCCRPSPAGRASPPCATGRVYFADGNAYFNRPGPRLADSAEMLAEMLHPGLTAPRHQGTAWVCTLLPLPAMPEACLRHDGERVMAEPCLRHGVRGGCERRPIQLSATGSLPGDRLCPSMRGIVHSGDHQYAHRPCRSRAV